MASDRYPKLAVSFNGNDASGQPVYVPLFGVYSVDDFHRVIDDYPYVIPSDSVRVFCVAVH